jgi:hypothetical protein
MGRLGAYYVAGPQLRIDGSKMPWGWEHRDYDDADWLPAKTITRGSPAAGGTEIYWGLVAREIPLIERKILSNDDLKYIRGGKDRTECYFPREYRDGEKLLMDIGKLENFIPTLKVSGPKGAKIKITYAESLIYPVTGQKGHRTRVIGKVIKGVYDEFILPGERITDFCPLWFRTARYVELSFEVPGNGKLRIENFIAESFAYPFTEIASFTDSTNTHRTKEIWDVGWQTARMCAQETYVDCPYYEQLQYVGDTRIQALISLYVSGDDRLMRKAIKIFDESRITEGLTQSRYPSKVPQVIPPYSLSWVEMVGDYWMHRPDTAFVRARLEGVNSVLNWYDQQLLPNGLIGPTPYWNFVDWTPEWSWDNERRVGGVPDLEGGSSILSLQYVSALRTASELFAYFDDIPRSNAFSYQADQVAEAVTQLCWNGQKEIFSDTPSGAAFSQHANILALLTDLAPAAAPEIMKYGSEGIPSFRQNLLDKVLTDQSLTQVSEYFRFYLIQALFHTGRADLYVDQLKVWEAYLDQGFTTFPEKPGETRSDCHAWSASPNYDLLATLAGIRPASPGFKTISVTPAYTDFAYRAVAAHPRGTITVNSGGGGKDTYYEIELPAGVTGTFQMEGQEHSLREGKNQIIIGHE